MSSITRNGSKAMKTQISLLPPDLVAQRKYKNRKSIVIMGAIILFAAMFFIFGIISMITLIPAVQVISLQGEKSILQNQITGLQKYQDVKNRITTLEGFLVQAMGNNPSWGNLLSDIGQTTSDQVWFTDVACTYKDNKGTLLIKGWTLNQAAVSTYLSQLESNQVLQNVQCTNLINTNTQNQQTVQFEITADIKSGAPYQLNSEGGL
jgi:Tfp pilus assembly protein PilN